jgi:hypothetical protein
MDIKDLGLEIELLNDPQNPDICTAHFFSNGVKLTNPPQVCCKRKDMPIPEGQADNICFPPIDNLERHNTHVPKFTSQVKRQVWIDRIRAAVEEAADKYGGEILPAASADDQS